MAVPPGYVLVVPVSSSPYVNALIVVVFQVLSASLVESHSLVNLILEGSNNCSLSFVETLAFLV